MDNNLLQMQFQMIRSGIEEMKDCKHKSERFLKAETLQIVLDNLEIYSSQMYNKGFGEGCEHAAPHE